MADSIAALVCRFGGRTGGRFGGPLWCADSMAALVGRIGGGRIGEPHWCISKRPL